MICPILFFSHGEDLIVTPFAQILASLRSVRQNYVQLTGVPAPRSSSRRHTSTLREGGSQTAATQNIAHAPDGSTLKGSVTALNKRWLNIYLPPDENYIRASIETLEELDWCLDQLETIQTHRSVSDMATSKVRKEATLKRRRRLGIIPRRVAWGTHRKYPTKWGK